MTCPKTTASLGPAGCSHEGVGASCYKLDLKPAFFYRKILNFENAGWLPSEKKEHSSGVPKLVRVQPLA